MKKIRNPKTSKSLRPTVCSPSSTPPTSETLTKREEEKRKKWFSDYTTQETPPISAKNPINPRTPKSHKPLQSDFEASNMG
jgi:hypothetical protein